MISDKTLKKQLDRLLRLPYVPRDPDAIKGLSEEYRRVLRGCCRSDAHCGMVVDSVVDTERERIVSPADIVATSQRIQSPDAHSPQGCDLCEGTGWRGFTRTVMTAAGEYEADYRDFCSCPKGHWMKAGNDRRRDELRAKAGAY